MSSLEWSGDGLQTAEWKLSHALQLTGIRGKFICPQLSMNLHVLRVLF